LADGKTSQKSTSEFLGVDEHGEPECRKVAMMIQNWSNASQKEQGLILETLVCHFTGQASTMALSTALSVSKCKCHCH
jgi:hypothetical protein